MIQQDERQATPATVKTIPDATPERSRAVPWLVAALVVMTAAVLALSAVIVVPRFRVSEGERLTTDTIEAWDSAPAASMSNLYAKDAVIVQADGTKVVGVEAIVAAAKALGPDFSMTRVGEVTITPDGSIAMAAYRFAGEGKGTGVMVVKISDGRITRQWNFETT